MRIGRVYFLCLMVGLFSPVCLRADGWQLKVDQQGIQVYQQHRHPEFRQRHTLGQVKVEATVDELLLWLGDVGRCREWLYGCLSGERMSDGLIRMVFEGPLWFKDRSVVFSTELTYISHTGQWLIQATHQPHQHPFNKRNIRHLEVFAASWLLTPVTAHSTYVSYELYLDPGLAIKAGVNKYNRDATFLTLQSLRQGFDQSTQSAND